MGILIARKMASKGEVEQRDARDRRDEREQALSDGSDWVKSKSWTVIFPDPRFTIHEIFAYLPTSSNILNIGMNMAMTMLPTTRPRKTIRIGSIMEVRPETAVSTWSS